VAVGPGGLLPSGARVGSNRLCWPDEAFERLKTAVAIFAEVGEEGGMEPEIWKLVERWARQ
jgi:hypothetical protein